MRAGVGCLVAGLAWTALAGAAQAGPQVTLQNGSFESTTTNNGGTTPGYVCGETYHACSNLTGWTNTDGYSFITNSATAYGSAPTATSLGIGPNGAISLWGATASPDGGNFLAVDGDTSRTVQVKGGLGRGTLSQMVTGLVVGDNYAITFYQAAAEQTGFYLPTTELWQVSLGGATLLSQSMHLAGAVQGANNTGDFSGWTEQTLVFNATSSSELLSFFAIGTVGTPPFVLLDGVSMADVPEPATFGVLGLGALGLLLRRRRMA